MAGLCRCTWCYFHSSPQKSEILGLVAAQLRDMRHLLGRVLGVCGALLGTEMINCWVFSSVFGLYEPKYFTFSKSEDVCIYSISCHSNSCDINMFGLVLEPRTVSIVQRVFTGGAGSAARSDPAQHHCRSQRLPASCGTWNSLFKTLILFRSSHNCSSGFSFYFL